jgi:hypothetical protein
MSRKSFVVILVILLAVLLLSACAGAPAAEPATEAPAAEAPAAEAPAPEEPAMQNVFTSPEFTAVSAEAASSADLQLYASLSAIRPSYVDPTSLAVAIKNLDPKKIPAAPAQPVRTYQLGDQRTFWVRNSSTLQYNLVTARLTLTSNHAYFWQDVNSGQNVSADDWSAAGGSFDQTYEQVRAVFGSEESLGLDGDHRLFIVHSDGVGEIGGYFNETDQLPAVVESHSNEGQYFFISNSRSSGIASPYYKEILAHEFQHMIQKNVDPDEEGWLDEGFSMFAQQVAGMRGDTWVSEYLRQPDQSLWYWGKTSADYGQAYLYLEYLYEQFGADFIKALAANPANGATSIEQTLKQFNSPRNADTLYADSITAAVMPSPIPVFEAASLPMTYQGTVQQYGGVDILSFSGTGRAMLNFTGDQRVKLIPADAHSGDRFWWSNRNDGTFATLTRRVDLRNVSTASLKYWAWFDIEESWDYAYLLVSTDNGIRWTALPVPSSRETNPNGQNLGHGFSGKSGGGSDSAWIQETANLNAYAGKQIMLRFAMQNNRSVNNFGFAVDDLSIPEIGWSDNVESGGKDWSSGGFVPIHNRVPQTWGVRAVEQKTDGSIVTHDLEIKNGAGNLDVDFNNLNRLVVFVIGQTHFTTLPASYRVEAVTK